MKMCSFGWNIGLLPIVFIVMKNNPILVWSEVTSLRIDQDIDENVQFFQNILLLPLVLII